MAEQSGSRLTVYFIDFLGSRTLGAEWPRLCDAVSRKLGETASASRDNDLWGNTYTFATPAAALRACCATIDAARNGLGWREPDDPLPVQFLLHHEAPDAPLGLDPRMWAFMLPEEIYVTKKAWERWQASGFSEPLPPHTAHDELLAALRLSLTDRPTAPEVQLFPRRSAPLAEAGGDEECFYCGVLGHRPAQCPSRYLRPDASGLSFMGHLPLQRADQLYAKVFSRQGEATRQLQSEVGPGEIRKQPPLQALCAFYDLRRIFQPRFLVSLFLSGADSWQDVRTPKGNCGESRSAICRGWRALVAKNYPDAETLFGDVKGADPGTKFFGEVGLAFVAVEKGQPQKVRYHLERAGKIADTEAERLYLHFLRSRALEVSGDIAGALLVMDQALEQRQSSDDSRYVRERLAVRLGRTDGSAQRLQLMASRNREAAVALLLDPWLDPIRGELDRKLLSLFLTAHQGGKGKYVAAKAQGSALAAWLGERDPEVVPVISGLHRLESKVSQAGYFDMLELQQVADKLNHSCGATRNSRSRALRTQIDAVEQRWQPLHQFWQEFSLKGMYRRLGERFTKVQTDLAHARRLAHQDNVQDYKEAMELVKAVNGAIGELTAETREIGAMPLIYAFVSRLLAYLVVMESLALAVGLAILPLFRLIFSIGQGGHASSAGSKPILYTLAFAVAPVLSLVLAARKQQKVVKGIQAMKTGS